MILTQTELLELYEGVVKPFGHPDPLGFMTRALLLSEGDPDYVNLSNEVGFMPVVPDRALDMVGASEVQSLQGNVVATLAMDRLNFDKYRGIDEMILVFHFGESVIQSGPNKEQRDFLNEVKEARPDTYDLLYPRMATVADVIEVLGKSNVDKRLTQGEVSFFEFLLGE